MKPAAADRIAEPQLRFPHVAGEGGESLPGQVWVDCVLHAKNGKEVESGGLPQINGQTAVKTLKHTRGYLSECGQFWLRAANTPLCSAVSSSLELGRGILSGLSNLLMGIL